MSARDIVSRLMASPHGCHEDTRQAALDAYRAEVLREAAALVEDRACDADFTAEPEFIVGLRTVVELLTRAAASPSPAAGDKQPETEALCRCGHGKHRHVDPPGTPICMDCPGDEEQSWCHPYTPASKGGAR